MQENIEALAAKPEVDAERVTVAHILISFAGTGTAATRSKEEAEELAAATFARVQAGEDFDALAQELSDDAQMGVVGGPYAMFMPNKTSQKSADEYPRTGMVPAFGNVGWKLALDEVGVASHSNESPYGWHIIKRVK